MLSSGFYNSKGGDRKYDAEQFGAMFNGLITDGVFAHYKDALKVTAGSGNRELVVKPGRAWFNGTWTEVDDNGHSVYLMGSAVETTYFVYLAVNKLDRKNTIAWYSNIANDDPDKGLHFYLLAQVIVPGGATKISDSMIIDTRGSDLCPYVTGVMETVSFEEIVKRVCGDSWQDWLGVYEAGITAGVQNAVATSERALDEVKSMKAYAVESEAVGYVWAKFEAVPTGGGGFEWATDSVHTELSDPPMPLCLFGDLSYADLGPGFKPSISLSSPYIADGATAVKAIPAVTQSKVWKEYPYFWEGGATFGTEVLRYDDLQRVVVNVGGTATEKYRYRVSRLMHIPVTYEPGAYIGTVSADNATAYPRDGYKDGYYYMRFASRAEDVSFYYPGLSAKNVRDAIIEVVHTGGNGPGTTMSVIEVEELPSAGIRGVFYIVKKPGDSDASEYLWLDRWERVGGSGSGQNPSQGVLTTAQINALHGMFKVCLFDDSKDVSGAISAFEAAFGITGGGEAPEEPDAPDVPVIPTYAVAYELVNVSSDNRTATVSEGAAYTATLTAAEGYTMDGATVSVTMGGADITADVYADGVISIPAVTGNVSIMASAQVVEAEPELITDGLMAFWDFRQEKEPVVQVWHWAYPADVGDGGLYASIQGGSNGSKPLPTFGEQGTTSSFHIMLDSTTYPADVEIASEFTVVALSYGGMTGSHYIASTNIDPRWAFSTAYYTADGTKKITGPVGSGPDIQTGYDFVAIRVSDDTANVIANTSAHTFNGGDYADFDHWTRFAKVGALNNGTNVAYAVYNRALTDVEIENMRAFYKTMEVRA